jgi:hypothetical protein
MMMSLPPESERAERVQDWVANQQTQTHSATGPSIRRVGELGSDVRTAEVQDGAENGASHAVLGEEGREGSVD